MSSYQPFWSHRLRTECGWVGSIRSRNFMHKAALANFLTLHKFPCMSGIIHSQTPMYELLNHCEHTLFENQALSKIPLASSFSLFSPLGFFLGVIRAFLPPVLFPSGCKSTVSCVFRVTCLIECEMCEHAAVSCRTWINPCIPLIFELVFFVRPS